MISLSALVASVAWHHEDNDISPHNRRVRIMRIGAMATFAKPPDEMVSILEARGIDSFWMYEIFQGYEAFARAGYLAAKTSKARVSVGVINPYSRHPAIVGMGASFLSNITKGRASMIVGVGSGDWVGKMQGYDQSNPGERLTEFVKIVRQLLDGNEVSHRSDNYVLNKVKLFPTPEHKVPIMIACEQPNMMIVAGRVGDGVYLEPTACPTGYIKWAAQTARKQSSKPDGFRVIANLPLSITDDVAAARASIKPELAFHLSFPDEAELYLGKAGFSTTLSDKIGEASGVRRLIKEGRSPAEAFSGDSLKKAAELVPDEFVDQCAVFGDLDTCKDRLKELERAGLSDVVFYFQDTKKEDLAILTG